MTSNELVRIGILGTGVGLRTLVPGFRATGRAEIVGLVGSSHERAVAFASAAGIPHAFSSYQQLVDSPDIDLVCVASPNLLHFEEAKYTLAAKKHLLVEKPLASTLGETIELSSAVEHYSRLAVVDHQLRFNPYVMKIKSILRSGQIGRPYFVRIHQQGTGFSRRDAAWNWSFDDHQAGGVLLAMGSHLLDLLWYWLGQIRIHSVYCAIDPVVVQRNFSDGSPRNVRASSFFEASLNMQDQIRATLSATAAALGESRFDIDLFGSEGELHFDLSNKLCGSFLSGLGKVEVIPVEGVTDEEVRNAVSIFKGSFVYFAPKLVEAVRTNDLSHVREACTFREAVRTQEVLESLRESACRGTSVTIDEGYSSRAVI